MRDGLLIAIGVLSLRDHPRSGARGQQVHLGADRRGGAALHRHLHHHAALPADPEGRARTAPWRFSSTPSTSPPTISGPPACLSAFLDNAPTYLTFFSTALGSFYPGVPEERERDAPHGRAARLPGGDLGRLGLLRRLQLHRQRPQLHGPLDRRGGRARRCRAFSATSCSYALVFLLPGFVAVTLIFFDSDAVG
ncbi:MAG: hypothetical protein MZV70_52560 [Desulfobacterales bacterium]|nr:hypothetical protein [Desulfobacterales bacterium]